MQRDVMKTISVCHPALAVAFAIAYALTGSIAIATDWLTRAIRQLHRIPSSTNAHGAASNCERTAALGKRTNYCAAALTGPGFR